VLTCFLGYNFLNTQAIETILVCKCSGWLAGPYPHSSVKYQCSDWLAGSYPHWSVQYALGS